mmetsp:Transcript_27971/g.61715  ORF Transcript_27971/g.61715 Transcript_27971/m.61715 type:complete len:788 (+) Transcript_27971:106-2469(+)
MQAPGELSPREEDMTMIDADLEVNSRTEWKAGGVKEARQEAAEELSARAEDADLSCNVEEDFEDGLVATEGLRPQVPSTGCSPVREAFLAEETSMNVPIMSAAMQSGSESGEVEVETADVPDEGVRAFRSGLAPHSAQFQGIIYRGLAMEIFGQTTVARTRECFERLHVRADGLVTEGGMYMHVRELLEQRGGAKLHVELCELLSEVVRRTFAEAHLGYQAGRIGSDEWVHYILMRGTAPSYVALECLKNRMLRTLRKDPPMLSRMLQAFDECDSTRDGRIRPSYWDQTFRAAKVPTPDTIDLDGDGFLDYYEFVAHAVGATKCKVELVLYDLSNGVVKWMPSKLLVGHHFEGIWHTGVRVYDREYWYGGSIFECESHQVPFDTPTKLIELGYTLRTRQELVDFIQKDLALTFSVTGYDILSNNCNNFSNEVVQFLLDGQQQIPEYILLQPQWASNATITHVVRPALNKWLGGFGSSSSSVSHSRIDDVTQEWRNRLAEGDIVLYRRRFIDRARVVRILSLCRPVGQEAYANLITVKATGARAEVGEEALAQLGQPWCWVTSRIDKVRTRHLYPCSKEAHVGAYLLNVGMALDSPDSMVLMRTLPFTPSPCCVRGHPLERDGHHPTAWISHRRPTCHVCSAGIHHGDMVCQRCPGDFYMCNSCIEGGLGLAGGTVFSDLLSVDLAKGLLANSHLLKYKAECYYLKADCDSSNSIDRTEWHALLQRLHAELGLAPATSVQAVDCLEHAKDLDAFTSFFRSTLLTATRIRGLVAFHRPAKQLMETTVRL